ncbi:sugar transferase [Catalinimonas niigatensis]|uniref:sugar transferase n=1 Tax=Catalinimonas niigatensis TaxID=1397264 RepID=UPI00266577FA|nr:sugar transferase [Catalinimonas niigatensis]WPP52307.1 sugar transferase [Catalinimonas niigatensis]
MYTGKRILDITISLAALLIAIPCLLLAGVFLMLFSTSSPIYTQKRPGYMGKTFTLYKLRTMYDKRGVRNLMLNSFGKLLRTYSIDELPQLFNVLKGNMSIVGPRPLLLEYLPLYNEIQLQRHEVKPGITGWAQINGRNKLEWGKRFELDIWYVHNQSLKLDILIISKTIQRLLAPKDVKPDGLKEEKKFKGNISHQW